MSVRDRANLALNGVCPYFTMFPLEFPYSTLLHHSNSREWVLDPFCGRGTTNYAGRLLGLPSIGIDSSPVATAIARAKLANTTPEAIYRATVQILDEIEVPREVPDGEFWELAYHQDVLHTLCRLREGLLHNCRSHARRALRAILMGALHGPLTKSEPSYFSNQSPRTYAPKPKYAVSFWQQRNLVPQPVDVLRIIEIRAQRYYSKQPVAIGRVILGDSRRERTYAQISKERKFGWVITSPPYYGMYTYIPDQWLRMWFLGGRAEVDYSHRGQIQHSGPDVFVDDLRTVWQRVGAICNPKARLVIRFGAISDRSANASRLLKESLRESGWLLQTIKPAGSAAWGRRQALHFGRAKHKAIEEFDAWATWRGN